MFSKNTNSGSLFNNSNTSTPTSTPTPSNSTLQKPLKGNTLFGNAATGPTVSTPSPSGPLFNGQSNSISNTQSGSNNLFGTQSSGILGGSNNRPLQNTALSFGQNSTNNGGGGGLFGRSNSTGLPSTNSNAGSSISNFGRGTSLFGSTPTNPGSGGAVNSNTSNNTGLFGKQQSFNQPQGNGIFNNNLSSFPDPSTGVTQSSSNPYGINITNNPIQVTKMPASLTAASKETRTQLDEPAGSTGSVGSSFTPGNKRTFSTSSATLGRIGSSFKLPPTSQSSLMNKLNSRLKETSNALSTQGIFSPSSDRQWALQRKGITNKRGDVETNGPSSNYGNLISKEKFTPFSLQKNEISDLRKLKIDPNRSSAKKLKLLSGKAFETKNHIENHEEMEIRNSANNEEGCFNDSNQVPSVNKESESGNTKENKGDTEEDQIEERKTSDYWCSPPPEQLMSLTPKELAAVSNFLIGRRGYGCITFDYDVDLTSFSNDFKGQLFGETVVFNSNKTVEVYPDELLKPPVGCGLNVPATITLENVYPVDKRTKKQLREGSNFDQVQVLIRRLKGMRNMAFVSYNPFGGVWTFKVKHFSIWGLTNEEDAEIGEDELEPVKNKRTFSNNLVVSKQRRQLAQSKAKSEDYIPGNFSLSETDENENTARNPLGLGQQVNGQLDAILNESENDDSLIDEKPYEPDVKESDFEGMEAEQEFSTSSNWVEQLKLAGSNLRSVFAETYESRHTEESAVELLFADFNDNMLLERKIKKERRLTNSNFASFSSDSSLLIKASAEKIGVRKYTFPPLKRTGIMDILFSEHLSLSKFAKRETIDYPKVTGNTLQFKDVATLFDKTHSEYSSWELCSVLFDEIASHDVADSIVEQLLLKMDRHKLLCSWIVEQVRNEVDSKIQTTTDALDLIFLHLLKNDVSSASKIAIKSQNGHLAVLIASLGSNDPRVRTLASQQLEKWSTGGCKVNPSISRVYHLLTGNGIDSSSLVKFGLNDISWLAILGVNLYYGRIDEYSLEDIIRFAISSMVVPEDDYKFIILKLYSAQNSADVLFQEIIKTASKLDNIFLWYFAQIVRFSNQSKISSYVCDKLTHDFIGQLRLTHHFKEALLAACFITDDLAAKQQIDSLVFHEILYFSSESSKAVLERLEIPYSLIYKAKALRDKYENDRLSEAQNLLKAKSFDEAENVVVTCVGPRLIISGTKENHDDLVLLKTLLSKFPALEMPNWSFGLEVFDNYLQLKLESSSSDELLDKLIDGLKSLYEANKRCTEILVCCNIISQEIFGFLISTHQSLDASQKDKLLGLPLGQPEKAYLRGSWD